jgi:hypothetical protein
MEEATCFNTAIILKGANVTHTDSSTVCNGCALGSIKPTVVVH